MIHIRPPDTEQHMNYVAEYRRALLPDGCEYCGLSLVACHAAWHVDGDIGCCASCEGAQSHA